jgi:hypothetical protein
MLTLAKNPDGLLCYLLSDDPAYTQADGLAAWRQMLADLAAARTPDETAEAGHECDVYGRLFGNVECLVNHSQELAGCDDIQPDDAQFIADVFTAFREWIDADPSEVAHWRQEFEDVLELFAAA